MSTLPGITLHVNKHEPQIDAGTRGMDPAIGANSST